MLCGGLPPSRPLWADRASGTICTMGRLREHVSRLQMMLLAATAICYAVGYPLGIVGRSVFGWVLVTVGGVLLLTLGTVTVRRIHQADVRSHDAAPR
jgi:hypothetical protein